MPSAARHMFHTSETNGTDFSATTTLAKGSSVSSYNESIDNHSDNSTDDAPAFAEFDDMGLHDNVLRGIYGYGFEHPTAIQQRAIVPMSRGRDCLCQAQAGTGKTGAFTIGVLAQLDPDLSACQAVLMSPTRELALQTHDVMTALSQYMGMQCALVVGGASTRETVNNVRRAHIVVGTPGRVWHMLSNRSLIPKDIRVFVIDEADEMLGDGFQEQIRDVFAFLPSTVQVGLFSATLPDAVLDLSAQFMRDPLRILVKREQIPLQGIHQFYIALDNESQKLDCLLDLYSEMTIAQSIIFVNTRRQVEQLAREMNDRDFTVSAIHSELTQAERNAVVAAFRSQSSRVLISTDLLGRGFDVQQVSLVFNYDLPPSIDNYVHRVGRSGRFGRKGVAINLVCPKDVRHLRDIERHYSTTIGEMPQDIASYM